MKFKELLYLIVYSLKSLLLDLINLLSALRHVKTWSFILYATLFLIAYYHKLTIINAVIIIGLILLIYIARQHKDPDFNTAVKEKAFLENDEEKIKGDYESYKKQCYFTIPKKEPLSYEEYKQRELKQLQNL